MGQEQDLIMIINSNLKVADQCLEAWNRANKMLAIINRNIVCKVLHLSYSNKEFSYDMNGVRLQSLDQEKDLGVIVSCNLKVDDQCLEANKMPGIINRNVVYKKKEVI